MKDKNLFLELLDYSVSGESFQLLYNAEYDMLETHPKPKENNLNRYYQSEEYISHTDSKRNLFEKTYHVVRQLALRNKVKLINKFNQGNDKELLDIGCGTGDFLNKAFENGWNIYGIEPNEKARAIANDKTNNHVFDSETLFKIDHKFDVITLWHVLEHVSDLENYINQIKSLLKPNGIVVIAVPNFKSYDAKHYKSFWAAYDVPRHLWHFSKKAVSKLFGNVNIELIDTKPMFFDSFYVSLLSEKFKTGSMNLFKAFFIGLYSNIKGLFTKQYSSRIYILKNT